MAHKAQREMGSSVNNAFYSEGDGVGQSIASAQRVMDSSADNACNSEGDAVGRSIASLSQRLTV
jgi:hypothetical protein